MCSPPLGESAEPALERRINTKHSTAFLPMQLFCTPTCTGHTHETTRTTSVIYYHQTYEYSNKQNQKPTHHYVFLNTDKWDSHPDASPEGARRAPPRGDERRQLNGALGAAMRLSVLSQSPPEITRPITTKKKKTKCPRPP